MAEIRKGVPAFEGLVLHEDRQWYYSFWYPKGWVPHSLSEGRIGVLCSPTDDLSTFFSVEVIPLQTVVHRDDLAVLCEGVQEGLGQLPELLVESAEESVAESQVTIERTYTFEDQRTIRKRRVRLMYKGDRLYSLMSQGATVAEYEYWLPMLNYCHMTFQLALFDPAQFDHSSAI